MSPHSIAWATRGADTRRWAWFNIGCQMCAIDTGRMHGRSRSARSTPRAIYGTIRETAMHPDTPDVLMDAAQAPSSPGHILEIHPDDIIGNESARTICAHYLGQPEPVTRPTLRQWRRTRSFPEPLPCHRAGIELWDAREVRVWAQAHAANLPKHRPANLRNTPGT